MHVPEEADTIERAEDVLRIDRGVYGAMRVEDILLRCEKRWDEIQRIRTVFDDLGSICE